VSTPSFVSPTEPVKPPDGIRIPLLIGAVIALLVANIYLFVRIERIAGDFEKFRNATSTEITNLREAASVSTATSRRLLDTLREELEAARRQAAIAVGQAKTEAVARAEMLARKLAEEQQRQQQQQQQMAGEISQVRQAATETATRVGQVSTEVGSVKTDVATTKVELDKTIAELKRMNGDMGVISGLIATNSKELSALKSLGDRNYIEFNLKKARRPQKVGDVAINIKRTDTKNNKFSIDLYVDDKRVPKENRTINEPLQFITSKARQPYELVVNEVRKDQIIGYLAIPKVQVPRD
jgi:chromosome segregation ATPase